jgi:predicted nucleic acid-binding protein
MAPTPGSPVFLDTNILVYSSFPGAPFYDAARARLSELESNGVVFLGEPSGTPRIPRRNHAARAVIPPPTLDAPTQAVRRFETEFEIADEDAAVTAILLDLLTSRTVQGRQIHDANIVATMRRYATSSLLTHNTADFTRYLPDINLLPLIS